MAPTPLPVDSGTPIPPVPDASVPDSGQPDAGKPEDDAGTPDSGTPDSGTPDAGSPADGGPGAMAPGSLGAAPFATSALTVFGAAQGLTEAPVSASVDEASNLWVVSDSALYLLTPGAAQFRRYTAADGLHVGPGYTEPPDVTMVEGGKPNECFVGYYFHDTNAANNGPAAHMWNDPAAHMGKMDQVLLQPDG
ncbi:MAG TPA: hypothetical protein VH083_13820, partial [Myxococcales bacterium]|nr:hypothetical protein [Myxococcales bacterium]